MPFAGFIVEDLIRPPGWETTTVRHSEGFLALIESEINIVKVVFINHFLFLPG